MATASFLRNRYWILRHGKSIPNEKGLIVSSTENGILPEYQLAPEGVEQARLAGIQFLKCKMIENLRERYFGPSFELLSHDKYEEIWALDEEDAFKRPEGGESVEDVASRLAKAILEIESLFQGCAILVVSHGDPLQIVQAMMGSGGKQDGSTPSNDLSSMLEALMTKPILSNHRQFALLTGELRPLL